MDQKFRSNKNDVIKILKLTKRIINSPTFNYKNDFILIERNNDFEANVYNNQSTLMLLNYDSSDIIKEILKLEYDDYDITIIDKIGDSVLLYVFKKVIQGYLLYIKYTIKNNKIIFCVSFHVSKEKE